jgi:uncharacterized surface protein with fasciclin (FAS1) repeats
MTMTRNGITFTASAAALALAAAATLSVPGFAGEGMATKAKTPAKSIVATAVEAGQFNTLAAALEKAGLVGTLQGKGPFTVFAPTDEAFAKLPEGTVAELLKPENKAKLVAILTYHVVPGTLMAADVVTSTGAVTLNGQRFAIKASESGVMVRDANVVKTDILCNNGVIHVIDRVILPETRTIPEVAAAAGSFKTLLAAVKAAGLAETLMGKGPFTVFAPTDEAFGKLPAGTLAELLKPENKAKLVEILNYHVVPGRVYGTAALEAGMAKTLQGGELLITATTAGATVGNAKLVATDIDASNGVIHVIDTVLLPTTP